MDNSARVRDHREPGHFWADNEIADQYLPTIGAYGFAVYMLLARYANNKTAQCDPSVGTISKALGISPPTVKKALTLLENTGLITVTYRPRKAQSRKVNETNVYTLMAVQKAQQGTQGGWVPKEIGYGVPNDVAQGTQGDLVGVPNHVGTNNTHRNKTQLTRESVGAPDLARALADLCKINPTIASKRQKDSLNAAYQGLKQLDGTPDQVVTFTRWWYSDSNWRTRKANEKGLKPEPPRPDQILEEWEAAKDYTDGPGSTQAQSGRALRNGRPANADQPSGPVSSYQAEYEREFFAKLDDDSA